MCRLFSMLRIVLEAAGYPRNVRKVRSFGEKPANLKVGVIPLFDAPEKFQYESVTINHGAIALFADQWPRPRCVGRWKKLRERGGARSAQSALFAFHLAFSLNDVEKLGKKFLAGEGVD